MKNNYKPEIRFSGLSGDWELRKLEDLLKERNEQMPANEKFQLMSFTATEGVTPKSDRYNREFLVKSDNKKYKKTEKDDLIYSSNNLEVGSIGLNKTGNAVISPVYSIFHVQDGITSDFMGMLIRRKEFINKMLRYRQGVVYGQWRIHESDFLSIETLIPLIEEQTKIGEFFKQLEETISLHQQELIILKKAKQSFLQKMFPKEGESIPEIRFPGFIERWKLSCLNSLVDKIRSYSLSRAVETKEYTGYKYIHYGDIHTNVASIVDELSTLPNIQEGKYELLEKGDLVLADASEDYQGIATPALISIETPYNLVAGLHTIALRPKPGVVDSLFLYYLIRSPIFKRYGYKAGTGMKVFGISTTNLMEFKGFFPSLNEQIQIGNFFKQLDKVIELHQQELETLKQTKKAFLQKMFV